MAFKTGIPILDNILNNPYKANPSVGETITESVLGLPMGFIKGLGLKAPAVSATPATTTTNTNQNPNPNPNPAPKPPVATTGTSDVVSQANAIQKAYPGYAGWTDRNAIIADYKATGGAGKGNDPYALGQDLTNLGAQTQQGVPATLEGLTAALANPDTSLYQAGMEANLKELPIIQQRYQALLDEIKANTESGIAGYETAQEEQIGGTRASAAARGVYGGSLEAGSEDIIRQQTAANEAILYNQATSQEEKANAQANLDELAVTKQVAQLGIDAETAQRTGLNDALQAIVDIDKAKLSAATSLQPTTVTQTKDLGTFTQGINNVFGFLTGWFPSGPIVPFKPTTTKTVTQPGVGGTTGVTLSGGQVINTTFSNEGAGG